MNLRDKIRDDLASSALKLGIKDAEFLVTSEASERYGDYASNIALQLSKTAKKNPLELAKSIADKLKVSNYLENVEVAGPGFLNFWVKKDVWQKQVGEVLKQDKVYGKNNIGRGKNARVEYVSANPTGPLHFGNARGGPIGDALASVLEFSGYKVLREYYHNNVGGQVEKLGESIVNVERGADLEDQEYKGEYVKELVEKVGKVKTAKEAGEKAVEILLSDILKDCKDMGIKFDKVFSESEFIKSGETQKALDDLKKKNGLKVHEGATWFAPHDKWLSDRETVVIKSDSHFTYFANDIAYHRLKFAKKVDLAVDVFGANHHGHVPRLQAVVEAFGNDVSKFHVILYQWVRFKRGGELVAMSKRSGTFVTAREILDEVGRDALRFFILMHDASTHIDFDLDLALEKSSKNPVYYVQYAHARIHSIVQKGRMKLIPDKVKVEHLNSEYELKLIREVTKFPELVEDITENFAVNSLTTYAVELANSFHKFYENVQVLCENKEIREARLALVTAVQITLKNTLDLLGIGSPKKM